MDSAWPTAVAGLGGSALYNNKDQPTQRRLSTYIVGVRWNEQEQATFQAALKRAMIERAAFIQMTRAEFGRAPVTFAIERAMAAENEGSQDSSNLPSGPQDESAKSTAEP